MEKQAVININSKDITFSTGSMALALGVHQRTLRIYDTQGILVPKRNSKNRRYYTLQDFEKGKFILFLTRNLALNLTGVRVVLAILEKDKIKSEDYFKYIKNILKIAKIDTIEQNNNILKSSKKGRHKKF